MTPHNVVPDGSSGISFTLSRTAIQQKDKKTNVLGSREQAGAYPEQLQGAHPTNEVVKRPWTCWARRSASFPLISNFQQRDHGHDASFGDGYGQRVPMELLKLAVGSLAHAGLTTSGGSCFFMALPQICCSRNGSTTSTAPIAQRCTSNARPSSVVSQPSHSACAISFPSHTPRSIKNASPSALLPTSMITQCPQRQGLDVHVVSYAVEPSQML